MLSTHTTKTPTFEASKLNYKSSTRHPLARFVTVETVALLFNRSPDEIYRIECWQHIVYVHGLWVEPICQLCRLSTHPGS